MKKLKIYFVMLVFCLPLVMSAADSGGSQHTPNLGKVVLLHQKVLSKRPNAPSRFYIECEYGDGFIEFVFPEGIRTLSVSIYNESEEWSGYVTTEEPAVEIPSMTGEYEISCTSDDGRIFSGMIDF